MSLTSAHRNPAIDRMMLMLLELERNPAGLGLKGLAERSGVTRSTVYRILNSLEAHGLVRQLEGGAYVLGSRWIQFASMVSVSSLAHDLPRAAQPHLERLAASLGESCKVSIHDRGSALVVAGAAGSAAYSLNFAIGQHLPLHAGAASKVLMAYLPDMEREAAANRPLKRYTDATLTDPEELLAELDKVRRQGWSKDPGEFSVSVNAYGAPIIAGNGDVVGAVSVPFMAGKPAAQQDQIRDAAIRLALAIGGDLAV